MLLFPLFLLLVLGVFFISIGLAPLFLVYKIAMVSVEEEEAWWWGCWSPLTPRGGKRRVRRADEGKVSGRSDLFCLKGGPVDALRVSTKEPAPAASPTGERHGAVPEGTKILARTPLRGGWTRNSS